MKILIFGVSGAGKTTLSTSLAAAIGITHFNADKIRTDNNDWDFSLDGRTRQLQRMIDSSNSVSNSICDFVCPLQQFRNRFNPDYSIWVNTKDFNRDILFEPSASHDLTITDYTYNVNEIVDLIRIKCGSI